MTPSILSQAELDAIAAQCREDAKIPRWVTVGLVILVTAELIVGLAVVI